MKYPIPFDHALFPLVAVFRAPAERGPSSKVASIATNYGGALKLAPRRYAAARELRVRTPDDAKKSDSFQNERPDGNPGADASHFHFLPGIDDVEIRWKVDRPLLASKTRFELWCATDGTAPVWSSDHEGAPTSGQEEGSIACSEIRIASDDRFPDRCPNAAHAPYQLRMVVTDRETGCVSTAWTYFDVVVDSIQLHWGAQALVPPGDIADVLPIYNALTDRDEKALVTALGQTTTRVPDTGTIEVLLKSTNAAYVNVDEWYSWRDFCFLRFKGRWGDGPRIPVIAKVFMKGLAGPVHSADAAKALGPARFLWDWCDRSETDRRAALAGVDSTTKAFVMKGLKYKENAVGEPPACLNAHADRGGKRGGASRVLPEWSDRAKFPFTVAAATTRSWAVFSTARTDGAQACCSGVVFQPCRMGGDTYKLRVFLATGRFAAALDVTDPMTRLVSDHDGLPGAESAMVEVLRQVDARYIRKGTSTPRMDLGAITTAYACGGVKLKWTEITWSRADFTQYYADARSGVAYNEDDTYVRSKRFKKNCDARVKGLTTGDTKFVGGRVDGAMALYDQWFGCPAGQTTAQPSAANFTVPGRDAVMAPFIDPVVKAYIEKNRRINDKKRRWNKFKTANPTVADGPLRVRFYSEVLTAKERTKLQPQLKVRYEAAGWKGWDIAADCPEEWANANYQYKLAKLVYLAEEAHQRKVMADGFEGVTFFHYQHFFEAMAADGTTVYARQCDIGGVASVSMNADLGLVGAFMVWDHPDNMQRQTMHHAMIRRDPNRRNKVRDLADPQNNFKDGNATAVHEFGHFLHLPHARPMGGAFEAAMHDANDAKCIMNYDPDALHLCGGCALRLRGWAFFRHGAVTGFSAADPAQPGKAPPAPADDRVTNVYTAFYTDFV